MPNSRSSLLEIAALHDIEELDLEMWALNTGFSIDYHIADMVLVATIPSSQVNKLIANLPKANDWISSGLLSEQAGIPEAWIEKQLDIYGMPRGEMFDNDGRLLTHYPPASLAAATFEDIETYHRRFVETVLDPTETTALGSLFSRVAAERKKLAKIQDDREKYERTLDMTYQSIAKARNEIIRLLSRYPSGS